METPTPTASSGTLGRMPDLAPRSAADALRLVASWREQARARHERELQEVDEEAARLTAAIEDLQRQLTALGDFRGELTARAAEIGREEHARAHEALFDALVRQASELHQRARVARGAEAHREQAIQAALESSEVASAWAEYQEFLANQEALAALPASYRTALALHHEATAARLAEAVRSADPGPPTLDEPELGLDVLFALGPSDADFPDLVSLVLPVHDTVWTEWRTRADDLQLQVAARVVQALYETVHALGGITAQAIHGGHRGLLAIELDLTGLDADAVRTQLAKAVTEASAQSPELVAARVTLRPTDVPVTFLIPPDGAETETPDEA